MKHAVIYSSLTGNTQKVAKFVADELGYELVDMKDNPDPSQYDFIIIGTWIDKGTADAATLNFMEKLKDRELAFFYTLGAAPDSEHSDKCCKNISKLLLDNNNKVLNTYCCRGSVSPKLIEQMRKFPKDHPHYITKEREEFYASIAHHPDENDLKGALEAFKDIK